MKCDKCRNYQPCASGQNVGYYTACKSTMINRAEKEEVIKSEKKNCRDFEKL